MSSKETMYVGLVGDLDIVAGLQDINYTLKLMMGPGFSKGGYFSPGS
jgi:hypothetical protein